MQTASEIDNSLRSAGVMWIFSEKLSTRATTRPELDKAIALARELRAPGVAVTLVLHEHKRLGRRLEPAALAEQLKASEVGLGFPPVSSRARTTRPGVVFTVLAALSGSGPRGRRCIPPTGIHGRSRSEP